MTFGFAVGLWLVDTIQTISKCNPLIQNLDTSFLSLVVFLPLLLTDWSHTGGVQEEGQHYPQDKDCQYSGVRHRVYGGHAPHWPIKTQPPGVNQDPAVQCVQIIVVQCLKSQQALTTRLNSVLHTCVRWPSFLFSYFLCEFADLLYKTWHCQDNSF